MTLTEFLLACIAEDEACAGAASDERLWRVSQANDRIINDAGHMQRFTPSRVLAECEAKRGIVESLFEVHSPGELDRVAAFKDGVLGLLALPYADHPDYDEAWRP